MQVLKDKWKNYRSSKKVQTLWNEYKRVSHLRDNPETLNKFELFIDTMQGYLRETGSKNAGNSQAESIFGHCNEMMSSMIQFLNQYKETSESAEDENAEKLNELLTKVLEIIEYLLKDPKFRKEIQTSPLLLQNFVDLIESVDQGESSTFLIKIIILMSENLETKIEFGKKQGFKKLFDLLGKKDERTSNLILTALIHFLDLKQSKTYSQNTARFLQELDVLSMNKKEEMNTVSSKLGNIAHELRKMVFGEFDRMFPNREVQRKPSLVDSPRLQASLEDTKDTVYEDLPNYETILAFDLSQVHKDLNLRPAVPTDNASARSTMVQEKEQNLSSNQEDTVKEFIVDQGALVALSNSLKEHQNGEGDFIFVTLDTLQQLLSGNNKLKEEFKKVDGYNSLAEIFNKPRNYSEAKNLQFLESMFSALKGFILSNNQSTVIQDYDAFQILLNIISGNNDPTVIIHALGCLSTILKIDWKNIVLTVRMNGFSHLAHLIFCISKSKALSQDSFTIRLITNFNRINNTIQISDHTRLDILNKTAEIFQIISVVLGVLNIDAEIIFAEFAGSHFLQDDDLVTFFLDTLLSLMEAKIPNVCCSVITLDYHLDAFVKAITNIFNLLFTTISQETNRKYEGYINSLLILAEQILRCNHTHDPSKPQERTAPEDLLEGNKLEELQNIERRSPFKGSQFDFNIDYKNLCAEIKSYLSYKFGEVLLNEKPQFKSVFSSLNYRECFKPEVVQRNLLVLRLLKGLLIANPKLMEMFEKLNGSALWMGVILRFYESVRRNNQYLVELLSFLFDILLDKNNVFSILKCYSTRNLETIPRICPERKQYLTVIQDILLKSEFDDEIADVFDIMNGLLNQSDNMVIFKENGGLSFLFNVMLNFRSTTNNFYTQTLTIFEQLITKFQPEDVDLFFETFFHPDFLKMCTQNDLTTLFVDLLSFLAIHVALHTNPVIIERIISQEYYDDLIGLLDYNHTGILDMTLKFLNVIFTSSSKVKKNTLSQKSKFIPLFIEMMKKVEPTQDLLQSVFELIFNNMDNIDILYPPNTSTVSSILNRSSIADIIIQNSKKEKAGKPKSVPNLASFEFLELFIYLLSKCKDENLLYAFWKQFEDYLDNSNMDKVADSNFIVWVAHFLAPYDFIQTPRFVDEVLSIIAKILHYDLNKQKNSKTLEILRKIEDEETLLILIVSKLIENISRNPIVKEKDIVFLKNLAHFFDNLEDIIGTKPEVLISMLHCINLLASRSTGEIRSAMKTQNLFEFRDKLLIQLLKFNLKSSSLYNSLKDFSFEAIANQPRFREAHIIAYLIRILLQNPDYLNLQLLILRILKEDITINDENVKYVTKIIENPTILLYLYPDYKQKSSGVIKCFTSVMNCETKAGSEANVVNPNITSQTSAEDFLRYLNSEEMENERKQIFIKINMMLIPVENDLNKSEVKFSKTKVLRKTKSQETSVKERTNEKKFITETQLKINQKFSKNLEKYKQKLEMVENSFNTRTVEVNQALDRYTEITQ